MFFVDVGAKDSLESIERLSSIIDIVGFEPNPKEFSILERKYLNNNFKSLQLEKSGLSDEDGKMTFNITKHSSMSSLLDLDLDNYKKHFGSYKEFENWENNVEVEQSIKVTCTTIDNYFKEDTSKIDFLKIDTQGTELKILRGAQKLLDQKRIFVLKIEVSTVATYKDQEMFSDIDIYLRKKGYVLVDFITYKERYEPVFGKQHFKRSHYAPCGDAIYVLDTKFQNNAAKIKSGILLLWLGYYSLGMFFLKNTNLMEEEIKLILKFNFGNLKNSVKQLIKNLVPPIFLYWIKRMIHFI
ncbi:MAG TPA: FkbM family methyltransferase [Flavobacteriaceae bacterium]|nr:FkbM family methyltransferase [Flavobacteriaceae bacterium]